MGWGHRSLVITSLWLCAGCAPVSKLPSIPITDILAEQRREQVAQIRDYYGKLDRVDTVAFRLGVANVGFCKTATPRIGMHAVTVQSLPRRYRSFSGEALGVSWTRPTVISVVPGSPADAASIKVHDQILAFDGIAVPPRRTADWIDGHLAVNGDKPVQVLIRHNKTEQTVIVRPVMACAMPINFVTKDDVNAVTLDDRIEIYSGILAITRTNAQLAVLVGHELAHANLGHNDKRRFNQLLGAAGGAALDTGFLLAGVYTRSVFTRQLGNFGALAYSVEFEREADYVGAYYAARAGYDIGGAEDLWRAMSLVDPQAIQFSSDHPTTPLRFVQMQRVAGEIAEKKRLHLPLIPELKAGRAAPDSAVEGARSF